MTNKKSYNSDDGWHFHLMSKREKWGAGSMWVRGSSGKGFGKKVNDDWKAGNWHHLLVSFEGEKVSIHSDGKSSGTGKITSVMNGLRNFTFSTKLKGYGFHGQLDDLRIYDRILTESEIIDIYEMGEFASKLASVDAKDDSKNGLTLVEKKFEEAMKKPVGEGIHIVESAANMEMIWCKPGSFMMGVKESKRTVILTKGFYLGKYEVTQEQYEKVMGKNPSKQLKLNGINEGDLPVDSVLWSDAVDFCKLLNVLEKDQIPKGWAYDLPTEAEWSFANKASLGYFKGFWWGEEFDIKYGNHKPNNLRRSAVVGSFLPNPWGFHDLNGNVQEWCKNYYEEKNHKDTEFDPQGPSKGVLRVTKGGAFAHNPYESRFWNNMPREPNKRSWWSKEVGFRLCLKEEKLAPNEVEPRGF